MARHLVPSTSPYAPIVGFSRAVRVGAHVCVGGTAPIGPDGKTVGVGDPTAQMRQCFEVVKAALEQAGSGLHHVVRTRMMLTRIGDWPEVVKVRAHYLRDVRPVDTVVEVKGFIDPEWLVELEVDAIVDDAA